MVQSQIAIDAEIGPRVAHNVHVVTQTIQNAMYKVEFEPDAIEAVYWPALHGPAL